MESALALRAGMRTAALASLPDLADFYRAEYGGLVGALTLYCGDRDLAQEVVQEAMARACRDWAKVQRLESPGAWVYRVAMNLAATAGRRRGTAERALRALRSRGGEPDVQPEPATAQAMALRSALAALPPRQRQAVVLRYYADLSVQDAAAVMGCAAGTVKALTAQGVQSLRAAGLATDMEETDER